MKNNTSAKMDNSPNTKQAATSTTRAQTFFAAWLTKRFWLARSKELFIIVLVYSAISAFMQRDMISGKAPNINAVTINQENLEINSYNEPTLVYFWGSWCPYCRVTSPMVNSVSQDYRVISIAVSSGTDEEIKQYLQAHGYQFATINDTQSLHQQWGVQAYPSIYIINSQGEIKFVTSGVSSSWGLKLRLWLSDL